MSMPASQPPSVPTGPSSELISRIHYLEQLLANLPNALPLDPEQSNYGFGLDMELVDEEGIWFAFNRNLEVCFETHKLAGAPITFTERGTRYKALIQMFKAVVKGLGTDNERNFLRTVWLERLIDAAKLQGAKIPAATKRKVVLGPTEESGGHRASKRANTSLSDAPAHPVASIVSITINPNGVRPAPANWDTDAPCRQLTFHDLGWKPLETEEEKREQRRKLSEFDQEEWEERKQREAEKKIEQKQRQRDNAAERQRRCRERKRAAQGPSEAAGKSRRTINEALRDHTTSSEQVETVADLDIAALSRPDSHWKEGRNGKRGGTKQERHKHTNWYHPLLWVHIDAAAKKYDWSSQAIMKALVRDHPTLFSHLNKGTVQRWIDKDSKRGWSKATIENVQRRHTLAGSGQSGVLAKYPEARDEIIDKLSGLRKSGLAVNVIVARSVMLSVIQNHVPALLTTFKCSERFVRSFLESVLNWSPRKGTRAAAKLPVDAEDKCEECFFRMVYIIKWHNVPPKLLVGFDQIGNYILPSSGTTFAERGSQQVDIIAKDEKRAYTLLVASTPDGTFLPFQQVWAGASERSLPLRNAPGMTEACERGFDFAFAKSDRKGSHFSTLKTMKEWVENIFEPYRRSVIESDPMLDDEQVCIVYLDCYPVHAGQDFRTYILHGFPYIILCFVPAGCTGIFQPADVGLNRVIKHRLKQHQMEFLVESHQKQVNEGLTPEQVKFTTSLPVLRDTSVDGIVKVYDFMTGPFGRELVQKSWERCVVKSWNLSADCLTSKKAQLALNEYLRHHPNLRSEIENRTGVVLGLEELAPQEQIDAEAGDDDADIPSSAVIHDAFGLDATNVPGVDTSLHCVAMAEKGADDGLVATGDEEDIWAYINFD